VNGMAKKYEAVFVINPAVGEDNIKALVEKFKNLIESSAQLDKLDEWGNRKLAYPIEDAKEGYYVYAEFSAEPDFPQELERNFKITEGVIRYLVMKQKA